VGASSILVQYKFTGTLRIWHFISDTKKRVHTDILLIHKTSTYANLYTLKIDKLFKTFMHISLRF
jgi:hypothetical protein